MYEQWFEMLRKLKGKWPDNRSYQLLVAKFPAVQPQSTDWPVELVVRIRNHTRSKISQYHLVSSGAQPIH